MVNQEASSPLVRDSVKIWYTVTATRPVVQSSLMDLRAMTVLQARHSVSCVSIGRSWSGPCVFVAERNITDRVGTNMRAETNAEMTGMSIGSRHVLALTIASFLSQPVKQ